MAGPASKRKVPPYGWPIVSTTTRAAELFGLEPGRLAGRSGRFLSDRARTGVQPCPAPGRLVRTT
jgi:hypothetical protein